MGSLFAAVVIAVSSRGEVEEMTFGDGDIAASIASSLGTPPSELEGGLLIRGPSLRFGRIGLPAAVWLSSAGRHEAFAYVQPILMVIAGGAASAAAVALFGGRGPLIPFVPWAAPGFAMSIAGGYAEAAAVALALSAVVWARRARWWPAAGLLAAAMLTTEKAAAVTIALAIWALLDRDRRALAPLALSLVPVAAWYLFVDARYGYVPLFDPYLRDHEFYRAARGTLGWSAATVGAPFVALWHSFTDAASASSAVTAGIHTAVAAVALALLRRSRYAIVAVVASLALLTSGPFAWEFIGDAFRVSAFLDLFTIMALVEVAGARRAPVAA